MATMTALKKVSGAISGIASAVSQTFVEQAHAIAQAGHEAWGGNVDIPAEEITTVVNQVTDNATWKGSRAELTRQGEVKAIIKAYNMIETAAQVFKREYGELRREHFVKLARMCPEYATPTDAGLDCADYFQTRDAKKGKGKSVKPEDKLATALTQAINAARECKNDALANSLTNLARKHEVKVK